MKVGNRWILMAVRRRDITMTVCMMHVVICVLPASEEGASPVGERALETADCGEEDDPSDRHPRRPLAHLNLLPSRVLVTIVVSMATWQWIARRRRETWLPVIISHIKPVMAAEYREDEGFLLSGAEFKR